MEDNKPLLTSEVKGDEGEKLVKNDEKNIEVVDEKNTEKKHNTKEMFWTLWMIFGMLNFLLFLLVVTCCIFLSTRLDGFVVKIVNEVDVALPKQYHIPLNTVVIPKDQASRGSCWIFSTIGMVESSYRKYGVEAGFLNENEYVQFSEQAYGKLIYDYCQDHKEIPICDYGGMGINQTSDGSVEFIYYLGDEAKKLILPHSVCEYYTQRGDGEFHCNDENLAEIIATNPIDFKIKDIKTMYSINEIKKTMFEHQGPISYGLATVQKSYYFECNEYNPDVNTSVCTTCEFPCYQAASGLYVQDTTGEKCCTRIGLASYSNDAVFDLHGEVMGSGGHAMVIVGWNDEFRVDRDQSTYVKTKEEGINRQDDGNQYYNPVKGGFIIKNSWGLVGHSIQYWMQSISEANEALICPLTLSIKNWSPVDAECLKTNLKFSECGFGKVRYVGRQKKKILGGVKLSCSRSSNKETDVKKMTLLGFPECGEDNANDYVYALVGKLVEDDEEGTSTVNLVSEIPEGSDTQRLYSIVRAKLGEDQDTVSDVEVLQTTQTTLQMLEKVFKPFAEFNVDNSDSCGYYFQPYSTIRFLVSDYKAWGYESYAFSYLDIQWENSSYLFGNENNQNYQWIKNSTVKYAFPVFDGPFGDITAN
ncbi:hypothetical protein EIN_062740 [Entamoeba invadens IP1]|uniref:hypothetical protein n=1 Tax=Entamoeba invadens IP1 TaxID=370355 RepID=UPI0002C3F49F|nr:hypothetical protein EIN_062740 [Entamoeba invadens IP1]ELP93579.1 hypothetical protein EIN_062740 [Entamoeba invadens IP1]|eukprot:XP_004260350.1 hypothetical protein EIN_062740 [Entamoeba invadens IP1]